MRIGNPAELFGAKSDEEMQIAPLIDVVFLLLIYFMVTTSLLRLETDLGIQLPGRVKQSEQLKMPDEQIVEVFADGRVMLNNQTFDSPNSRELPELTSTLKRFRQASDLANVKAMVTVQAEDEALHGRVIDVLNACAGADIQFVSVGMGEEEE